MGGRLGGAERVGDIVRTGWGAWGGQAGGVGVTVGLCEGLGEGQMVRGGWEGLAGLGGSG